MRWWMILALVFAGYYIGRNFDLPEPLAFSRAHSNPTLSPALDYYAGMVFYQRAEYPRAQKAFSQLLEDYPTAQYVPQALIRLEDSAEYNHDWDSARKAAHAYMEQFPKGAHIELMRRRLELVDYQHP